MFSRKVSFTSMEYNSAEECMEYNSAEECIILVVKISMEVPEKCQKKKFNI